MPAHAQVEHRFLRGAQIDWNARDSASFWARTALQTIAWARPAAGLCFPRMREANHMRVRNAVRKPLTKRRIAR
jgi:cytochrome P450